MITLGSILEAIPETGGPLPRHNLGPLHSVWWVTHGRPHCLSVILDLCVGALHFPVYIDLVLQMASAWKFQFFFCFLCNFDPTMFQKFFFSSFLLEKKGCG